MPTIRTRPEDLPTGLLLAGVGGFLDAYTFVGRGGVFANAQTGNIVLLGVRCGWQRPCWSSRRHRHGNGGPLPKAAIRSDYSGRRVTCGNPAVTTVAAAHG